MIPGDARIVRHTGDTVQHVEVIISTVTQQCVHVMTCGNRQVPDGDALGDVEIRPPLTEASSPLGWYVITAWYALC